MKGKKIILGITGSIAAYKTANLVRLLKKAGAEVKVIMTRSAKDFITPLTLSTLSNEPVLTAYFNPEDGTWNNHVDLGLWGDVMLIAPASANTLANMAGGICDNLLLAVYLSARCKVFVAPAMDLDMWAHESTQENIRLLQKRGVRILEPRSGELASGLSGEGRMQEPEELFDALKKYFESGNSLSGKKIMVTAGPTHESIDPVRFIGNHSSGKMGYAIANSLAERGAEVILISGPVALQMKNPDVRLNKVTSASEMNAACKKFASDCDAIIMAAAVADYRPSEVKESKIKKGGENMALNLVPTEDILAGLGAVKKEGQIIIGFALETDNEIENATKKLQKKNLDLIVLNSMREPGAGFAIDTNKITVIGKNGVVFQSDVKSKHEIAEELTDLITQYLIK